MTRAMTRPAGVADIAAAIARQLLVMACFALATVAPSRAQGAGTAAPGKIVVGTMRVPPFVLRGDDGQWNGLSVQLWKQIAAELKVEYEFREYDYDLAGLLDAVERHDVDAAIAAIPITSEGEARFDYSHPYFQAGLGIAVRAEPQRGMFGPLASLFTYQALGTVATMIVLLLLAGTLIWLAERRQKGHFDESPIHGIGDGIWWAAVTLTTTGYGDKVPVTLPGRSLALIWMFASIFFVTIFSATLASSFVVNRLRTGINGPEDLPRVRVATVSGTAGEEWLAGQGLAMRAYPFVIQASKALQRGDVQALVYEKAILGHMIKEYGWRELQVLPHTLAVSDYAIALPTGSSLTEAVNRALLKVVHRPDWARVVQRYVGETDRGAADTP